MKGKLIPVGCIDMLDRLWAAACHRAAISLPVACRGKQAVLNARINPRRADSIQEAIYHTMMKGKLPRRRVE